MYKITLTDGRTIDNLELNGNNFISETKIDESIFTDNLSTITFTRIYQEEIIPEGEIPENYEPVFETKEASETYHDMKLIQQVTYDWDNRWYLCFAKISEEEKKAKADAQLRADVDFISIMTGVDL